jgi:hypothetical protein
MCGLMPISNRRFVNGHQMSRITLYAGRTDFNPHDQTLKSNSIQKIERDFYKQLNKTITQLPSYFIPHSIKLF